MNEDIKKEWLAALRSGEYAQGKGRLCIRDDEGGSTFCCLGVLCEIAMKDGLTIDSRPEHGSVGGPATVMVYGDMDHRSNSILPQSVQIWSGLRNGIPHFALSPAEQEEFHLMRRKDGNESYSLAELNDAEGLNFDAIANIIERKL